MPDDSIKRFASEKYLESRVPTVAQWVKNPNVVEVHVPSLAPHGGLKDQALGSSRRSSVVNESD